MGPFTRKVSQKMAVLRFIQYLDLSSKTNQMTSPDSHDQTLEQAQVELKEVEPQILQSMPRVDDKVISGRLFDEPDELKPWKKDRSPAKRFTVLTPEALNNPKVYAKFSRRLGAHFVDWCIVNTICACAFAVLLGGPSGLVPVWLTVGIITLIPGMPILFISLAHASLRRLVCS